MTIIKEAYYSTNLHMYKLHTQYRFQDQFHMLHCTPSKLDDSNMIKPYQTTVTLISSIQRTETSYQTSMESINILLVHKKNNKILTGSMHWIFIDIF